MERPHTTTVVQTTNSSAQSQHFIQHTQTTVRLSAEIGLSPQKSAFTSAQQLQTTPPVLKALIKKFPKSKTPFCICFSFERARPLYDRNDLMKGSFTLGETPVEYKSAAMNQFAPIQDRPNKVAPVYKNYN